MARRRFQRGSLTKDGDRWVGRWREDVVLPSGEVKRVHKKEILGWLKDFPTKKLAERELAQRLEPVNRVDYRPTPLATFAEFAAKWQTDIMIHHKPSNWPGERSKIRLHLIPAFGTLALRDIQPEMLQAWVNRQTCSPTMTRNLVTLMKMMWSTAMDWHYVHTNPFVKSNGKSAIRLPARTKGNEYAYTPEEALAIIDKAQGRDKVLIRLAFEGGMRPGELAGLRVEDVQGRRVWVRQSVWGGKVQTPKSENSVRSFVVSESLAAALQRLNSNRQPDVLVFPSEAGTPLSMDNFRHRVLTPILDELGISAKVKALGLKAGLYPGRHMNATLLSRIVPMKTVQARLGHSIGSAVTSDHYLHALDSDDLAAADALGALLSPRKEEAVQ